MSIVKQQLISVIAKLQPLSLSERAEVARLIGVSESLVNKLRDGRTSNPTTDTLDRLVDYFDSAQTDTPKNSCLGLPEHSECGTGVSL